MAKDTITVVATGNQNTVFETPSMVSVVTNDTPWSQNAVTSAGMLKGVAGLSQTGAGRTNGQTFNLRGYDKSGVLVLVDGIRQLSDMAKSSGTYLDPALVKRIEVVRGPNSSLYGSGGLGGVVDFRTADAADFRHCCKVSDEAAFCLIQRPYISKTLLTRRISPRGSP